MTASLFKCLAISNSNLSCFLRLFKYNTKLYQTSKRKLIVVIAEVSSFSTMNRDSFRSRLRKSDFCLFTLRLVLILNLLIQNLMTILRYQKHKYTKIISLVMQVSKILKEALILIMSYPVTAENQKIQILSLYLPFNYIGTITIV